VYALGALCLGLGLAHLLTAGEGVGTVLETFVLCGIALPVVTTGYRLPDRPISFRHVGWRGG
jgi:hypothetical protein